MANEPDEILENEGTVLQMEKAENISLADILYLIQGTGPDRDRQMTLEQLRDFLQNHFTEVKLVNANGGTNLTAGKLKFVSSGGEFSISFTDGVSYVFGENEYSFNLEGIKIVSEGKEIGIDETGFKLTAGSKRVVVKTDGITFSSKNGMYAGTISYDLNKFSVDKDFDFNGVVVFNNLSEFKSLATFFDVASFKNHAAFESTSSFVGMATFNGPVKFNGVAGGRIALPVYESQDELPADGTKGEVALVKYNGAVKLFYCTGFGAWGMVA